MDKEMPEVVVNGLGTPIWKVFPMVHQDGHGARVIVASRLSTYTLSGSTSTIRNRNDG
jgi:hypothetical protein